MCGFAQGFLKNIFYTGDITKVKPDLNSGGVQLLLIHKGLPINGALCARVAVVARLQRVWMQSPEMRH